MASTRVLPVFVVAALAGCASTTASVSRPTATEASVVSTAAPPVASTQPSPSVTEYEAGVFVNVEALATELSEVEAAIRDPLMDATNLAGLGRRQQLVYRAINRHPEWHAAVLAAVDPVAVGPLTLHLVARQAQVDHAAGGSPVEASPQLPTWTIVEPLPIEQLRGYYDEAEATTGVPWEYLAAINFQETRMGRIIGESSAGAIGPMQFLPSTWAQCCFGDPTVARDAILGAAHYLVLRGAPADMQQALYGYNPNAGYVGAVTAYAQNMRADERAYLGYHGWQVFFTSSAGTVRLPTGYSSTVPIDAQSWLADHPDDLLPSS